MPWGESDEGSHTSHQCGRLFFRNRTCLGISRNLHTLEAELHATGEDQKKAVVARRKAKNIELYISSSFIELYRPGRHHLLNT